MTATLPNRKKLTGPNFGSWRNNIITALGYKDLDDLVLTSTIDGLSEAELKSKRKKASTFIRLHLDHINFTRFVNDPSVHDPKALWDAICNHYATRSMENAANLMDKLHDISFTDGNLQTSIDKFRETFKLLAEVTSQRFDLKTLEALWVFFILKRLPESFNVLRSLEFTKMKETNLNASISLDSFLSDLEMEIKRQFENHSTQHPTAMMVTNRPNKTRNPNSNRPVCSDGVHNPATSHSAENCNQLHPERHIAYLESSLARLRGKTSSNTPGRAGSLSNRNLSDRIIFDSGASAHYLKHKLDFVTYSPYSSLLYAANGTSGCNPTPVTYPRRCHTYDNCIS